MINQLCKEAYETAKNNCKRIGDLPANYCVGCGKELEEN